MAAPFTPALVRERLNKFLRAAKADGTNVSQSHIAKAIGVSPSMISAFLADDYKGDLPALCKKLTSFLDIQEAREQTDEIVLPYIDVRQTRAMTQCLTLAHVNDWIVVATAHSGRGKTLAINEYRKKHPETVHVRCWSFYGASDLLRDICEALGESERGLLRGLAKRIVKKLKDTPRLLIIDDAHDLSPRAFQIVRNIYDETGVGIVLTGLPELEQKVCGTNQQMEQVERRIFYTRRLPDFTDADAQVYLSQTLPHLEADTILARLDPKSKKSTAEIAKVIKKAATAAGGLEKITLDAIQDVLKVRKVA